MEELSVSRVYGFAASLYKEDFLKFLVPMLIPTLMVVGVTAVFYAMAVPAFEIENITQYYSLSTYAALKEILGTWYYILISTVVVYLLLVLYGMSTITGILAIGLVSGEDVPLDIGGRKGLWGFIHSILPAIVIIGLGYYLATSYGRYYAIISFILAYFFMYMISSTILDDAVVGKNLGFSMSSVAKAPGFSFLVFIFPLAITLFFTSVALIVSVWIAPALIMALSALVAMFLIPFATIIVTVGYMLTNSERYGL